MRDSGTQRIVPQIQTQLLAGCLAQTPGFLELSRYHMSRESPGPHLNCLKFTIPLTPFNWRTYWGKTPGSHSGFKSKHAPQQLLWDETTPTPSSVWAGVHWLVPMCQDQVGTREQGAEWPGPWELWVLKGRLNYGLCLCVRSSLMFSCACL